MNPLFLGFPEFRGCLKKSFVFSKGILFEKKSFFYSSIQNYEILRNEAKKVLQTKFCEKRQSEILCRKQFEICQRLKEWAKNSVEI